MGKRLSIKAECCSSRIGVVNAALEAPRRATVPLDCIGLAAPWNSLAEAGFA